MMTIPWLIGDGPNIYDSLLHSKKSLEQGFF